MGFKPGSSSELDKIPSQQLVQVQSEFQKGLAQIASLCGQLIGLELEADDVQSGKTVIKTLEEMRSEIEGLKTQYRKFKGPEAEPPIGEGEIIAKTAAEEETWLRSRIERTKLAPRVLVNGASMKGKTTMDLSEDIPITSECKTTATLQITNYMNESLTNPQFDFARATTFGEVPKLIVGCTTEVLCFQGDSKFASGLCSYRIGTSDLRLTVKFAAGLNGQILLGIGLTPQNVPVNGKLYSFNSGKPPRPDLMFMYDHELTSEPLESIVQHRHFLAKAAMVVGPKSIIEVDIMEITFQRTLGYNYTKAMEIIRDKQGQNSEESWCTDTVDTVPLGIVDKFACVIEITNLLNVSLEKPMRYIQNCLHHNLVATFIRPFSREIFYASDNGYVKGIFTYEIDTTDLQLAVVFQNLDREGSSYAIGFCSTSEDLTIKEMMCTLIDSREWKTRPDRKFAEAGQETSTIQLRNIVASASMTAASHSVLRIMISSL